MHSLKDAPPACSPGLVLGGCLAREDVRDAVLIRDGCISLGENFIGTTETQSQGQKSQAHQLARRLFAGQPQKPISCLGPTTMRHLLAPLQIRCPAEARWARAAAGARHRSWQGQCGQPCDTGDTLLPRAALPEFW